MHKLLLKLLGLFLIASNFLSIPAFAQYGGGAAIYQAWTPFGRIANVSFTGTTSNAILPTTGLIARVCNLATAGTEDAYVAFGTANTIAATTAAGSFIKGGTCINYNLQPYAGTHYTYIAAICGGTTCSSCTGPACQLYVETGVGAIVPGQ